MDENYKHINNKTQPNHNNISKQTPAIQRIPKPKLNLSKDTNHRASNDNYDSNLAINTNMSTAGTDRPRKPNKRALNKTEKNDENSISLVDLNAKLKTADDEQQQQEKSQADSQTNAQNNEGSSSSLSYDDDESSSGDDDDDDEEDSKSNILFPGYVPIALKYFSQSSKPRYWCLKMITSPWFERISMLVILINCITLGMYQPCNDNPCTSTRCKILSVIDHCIYVFFAVEMSIKICAMGFIGKDTYLAETWNRLDLFIVVAGTFEYAIATENLSLSAIRTIRVLRPLRAINRVPSMRILVMLLLDTLPMLGNVLLLCFFVFFIFGIVGVQLWKGVLRNRCFFDYNKTTMGDILDESFQNTYYKPEYADSFICTDGNGMSKCNDIPPYINQSRMCNGTIDLLKSPAYSINSSLCINWNAYYSKCRPSDKNPFKGAISFDNIGYAWVAIFQIISLESWVTIMYYIQDAHSFWNWIYFVFLIVIGSFFMINLCLVVIATQFSETKKRETERMIAERRRFSRSSSTLHSDSAADPGSCWQELLKYIGHLVRKTQRRLNKKYTQFKNSRKKSYDNKTLKLRKKITVNNTCCNNPDHQSNHITPNNVIHLHNLSQLDNSLKYQKINIHNHNFNCINKHFYFNFNKTNTRNNNNNNDNSISSNTNPITTTKDQQSCTNDNVSSSIQITRTNQTDNLSNNYLNNNYKSTSNLTSLSAPRASIDCYQLTDTPDISSKLQQMANCAPANNNNDNTSNELSLNDADSSIFINMSSLNNNINNNNSSTVGNLNKSLNDIPNVNEDDLDKYEQVDNLIIVEDCALCKRFLTANASILNKKVYSSDSAIFAENQLGSANDLTQSSGNIIIKFGSNNDIDLYSNYDEILSKNTELNRTLVNNELASLNNNTINGSPSKIKLEKPGATMCCCCCCCCCLPLKYRTTENRFCLALNSMQSKLKTFVDGKMFQRAILFAILINTLSMGIEHHEQPPTLTMIVEYSNTIFTFVFLIEMFLKMLAYGMFGYIENAYNMFDGIIVCISVYEVAKQMIPNHDGTTVAASGVSVLRTFRLLRILKLVRFMPALRRQLVVMLKTIDNVATFFSLLILFIFIFSILGMNLFGCKFCVKLENGTRSCERKNFDSLLWAIITVFQVLTQEDWNEVLYNGMERTSSWAALYFIALMTFGNYVLFNLLVAILVEGFSTEDEPKKLEDRIRADAIQAIVEENASREHSTHTHHHHKHNTSGSGVEKDKSRSNSKLSASNHEDQHHHQNRRSSSLKRKERKNASKSPTLVEYSFDEHAKDASAPKNKPTSNSINEIHNDMVKRRKSVSLSLTPETIKPRTSENSPSRAKFNQLPIITHTCPTPVHSPSVSSKNSPFMLKHRFLFDPIRYDQEYLSKYKRKYSLDSSANARYIIKTTSLNKLITRSTNSKIYDRDSRTQASQPTEIIKRPHSFDFGLVPKILISDAQTTNAVGFVDIPPNSLFEAEIEMLDEDNLWKKKRFNTKGTSRSFNVPETRSGGKSLAIPNALPPSRVRSKSEKVKMRRPNKLALSSENEVLKEEDNINSNDNNLLTDRLIVGNDEDEEKKGKSSKKLRASKESINKQVSEEAKSAAAQKNTPNKKKKGKKQEEEKLPTPKDDEEMIDFKCCIQMPKPTGCFKNREEYSLYVFSNDNKIRLFCLYVTCQKWFDYTILLFIALNCITLAMERPSIPPNSLERKVLTNSNYLFTLIFAIEMIIKVFAKGLYIGEHAYLKSGWNVMDGFLVIISSIDVIVTITARSSPKIFGILRVFRLLRTLRPLRVISRAPGLKLVVQTLLSSLRPIGNIVLICCTFFIIFGILGVQLFKGKLYHCIGDTKTVKTKEECLAIPENQWVNSQYNFDSLGHALMALFVLSSKDGWVQIMYTGIDAVGVDKQPVENYNEWMLLYFISFLLLVGFFVLNMFVGVVIENFHKCREEQEREEKARRAAKRAKKFEEKRRKMKEIPYYANYSRTRRLLHDLCNSKYFDLIIAGVIGLNVVSMSLEFYMMPSYLDEVLDIFNYIFTLIFLVEAIIRMVALGLFRYFKERWNQLDIIIVVLSIVGIFFDKLSSTTIPINPTLIRVMRVLRIARVLKLLKMAKGIRSLLDTVIQALPQVGNLGLLFFLLFFIFAILGVELFGKLQCESVKTHCDGLSKHAHFHNFGMAFLTLFRIATGDNWNGIMKDTLKENVLCQDDMNPGSTNASTMCLASMLAPIYFVIFVLMAQFVLVNVVVAVLMKHLDDSNKMMADDAEMDEEIEKQLEAEARNNISNNKTLKMEDEDYDGESIKPFSKPSSLPPNFTFDLSSEAASLKATPIKSSLSKHSILVKRQHGKDDDIQSNHTITTMPAHKEDPIPDSTSQRKLNSNLKKSSQSETASLSTDRETLKLGEDSLSPRTNLVSSKEIKEYSSQSNSINYETDSISDIIRLRKQKPPTNSQQPLSQTLLNNSIIKKASNNELDVLRTSNPVVKFKSHFSPQSSVRIKVIDETDTDN